MAQAKNPLFDTATVLGKIVAFLGVSAICGVLVAGLLVPAAAVTGSAASGSVQFFENMPADLTVDPPSQATRILASDGSTIATLFSENRTHVALKDMSPFIKDGIISIEDSRFYEHGGVDPTGIARALVSTAKGSRQGASTITQQYVNNVINESLVAQGRGDEVTINGTASKTIGVKLREMKLAIALEKKMSKDQILEGYLNLVFFNTNAYGIEAASQYFFSTSAKDLTLPQAATLAGLVNSPTGFNPITQPEASKTRRNLVLDAMLKNGKITQQQHDEAVKTPVTTKVTQPRQGCQYAAQAEYFCNYVENLILANPAYGASRDDRERLLSSGGLTIKTTLDPRLQAPAQAQVDSTAGANSGERKWAGALTTVQPGTGKILSMAQNSRYLDGRGSPQLSDYNFNVDSVDANGSPLGGYGGFQPGSTMKPITLTAWLNEGKHTDDYVDGTRRFYPLNFPWKTTCTPVSGAFDPSVQDSDLLQNDEGKNYRRMPVREGIYLSVNTATFASAAALNDFCDIQRAADALHLETTLNRDKPAKLELFRLGNLLGGSGVSPLTMASAYATFANNGTYCAPIAIDSVVDAKGQKYPGQTSSCEQALKPDVAKAVNDVLQDVMKKGSGRLLPTGASIPAAVGAKTGTNNYNNQTWMIGYTRGLATASYFGLVDPNPGAAPTYPYQYTSGVTVNGQHYSSLDGVYVAGPQMAYYMQKVAGLYNTGPFDPAPASLLGTTAPPPAPSPAPSDKKSDTPAPPPSSPADNGNGDGKKKNG